MLLPTDSIDVVINLSDSIYYSFGGEIIKAGACHFNGSREKPVTILQSGRLRLFGISFEPYGLFPFIKKPMNQFHNQLVDLRQVKEPLSAEIERAVRMAAKADQAVRLLEDTLMAHFQISGADADAAVVLRLFQDWDSSINAFCENTKVDIKQLERLCKKYIGLNPKNLKRVARIQEVNRQILMLRKELTALAYDNNFFDQSHFIKEFRACMGLTPKQFRQSRSTVKDITRYST